ncbi:NTP transferase domain-containing protein [bacterium]|nr:NTP transferase domain-containing protein [bacterium]
MPCAILWKPYWKQGPGSLIFPIRTPDRRSVLLIRLYSFSYKQDGPPADPAGHGGGFTIDCRGLPNPGRIPEMKTLSGLDSAVVEMLTNAPETAPFLDHAEQLVLFTANAHQARGFNDLTVMFGCTGGRHRSVFSVERAAERLRAEGFKTRVIHWQLEREEQQVRKRRAMILAAGFGTRLKPLTDTVPKALIQAGRKTMLGWTLEALERAGADEITINTHYHAEQVREWIASARVCRSMLTFHESHETEILGTGGGIRQAARYLHGPSPVLVHNVDIWSDLDLRSLWDSHRPTDAATLAVMERESTSYILVDDDDRMVGLSNRDGEEVVTEPVGEPRKLGFLGIHVISPRFLEWLGRHEYRSIIRAYLDAIKAGRTVRVHLVAGNWFDMGSPDKLEALERFLESKRR